MFQATIQVVGDLEKLEKALLNNHRASTTPGFLFQEEPKKLEAQK